MEQEKTLKDYVDFNDTEQMAYALYPKLRKGEINLLQVLRLLSFNVEQLEEIYCKYNLPTIFLTDKELDLPIEEMMKRL